MVFVIWIIHACGFHQSLFARKILSKLRGVGFAVRDRLEDSLYWQFVVRRNLLRCHRLLLTSEFAVEGPGRDPAILEKQLLVDRFWFAGQILILIGIRSTTASVR